MPKLSEEQVLRVAKLARLKLSAEEVARYQDLLGRVLDYASQLDEADGSESGFPNHIPEDVLGFREDTISKFPSTRRILENCPLLGEDESFLLPPVMS